ncbi:MAG: hypothetical protein BWZ02_02664 [Lentisphaerae bacterium ADurb.BinA184]|nr:MAG: hypothetical protein BWZ02_02664 [Lentisphaerae bacterium ADurb.BinA184]
MDRVLANGSSDRGATVQPHHPQRVFHIEILSPRQNAPDLDAGLAALADKYRQIVDAGHVACFTDNPLGNLAFQGTELIQELGLPVRPGQVSIHLNTFHTRRDLDAILDAATNLKIDDILVISGDGSERLPKLRGRDLGIEAETVTSVELVAHLQRTCPGRFRIGVAFNPYEPREHEMEKLRRKLDAGAGAVTTQPIIGQDPSIADLRALGATVIVEAWMSKKLHLLSDCVGYALPADETYDPLENLRTLLRTYDGCGFYLAMLGMKTQFPLLRDIWS